MEIKKPAIAGTMESSDIQIMLSQNPGKGIVINLTSDVKALFGESIEATIKDVLNEFQIKDAVVNAIDKGALDFVIRSRMQCAVCRACEIKYDWGRDDIHE